MATNFHGACFFVEFQHRVMSIRLDFQTDIANGSGCYIPSYVL